MPRREVVLTQPHVDDVGRRAHPSAADDPSLPDPFVAPREIEGGHDDEGDGENRSEDVIVDLCVRLREVSQQQRREGRGAEDEPLKRDQGRGSSETARTHEKTRKHEPKMQVDLEVYHSCVAS